MIALAGAEDMTLTLVRLKAAILDVAAQIRDALRPSFKGLDDPELIKEVYDQTTHVLNVTYSVHILGSSYLAVRDRNRCSPKQDYYLDKSRSHAHWPSSKSDGSSCDDVWIANARR